MNDLRTDISVYIEPIILIIIDRNGGTETSRRNLPIPVMITHQNAS